MADRPHPATPPLRRQHSSRQGIVRLACLAGALLLAAPGMADDERTSDRWDAAVQTHRVRSLAEAPAIAQPLVAWFDTDEGARLLSVLIDDGRSEQLSEGRPLRREVGIAGYIRTDGSVVRLGAFQHSEWYEPGGSAGVGVGKASAGTPWAVHTHSWGNSMSGILRGITDDFAYATSDGGTPGILVCLPLREKDGTDSVVTGRLQMIVPTPEGIACFEGRWVRSGDLAILL